jgi:hypothetical protein
MCKEGHYSCCWHCCALLCWLQQRQQPQRQCIHQCKLCPTVLLMCLECSSIAVHVACCQQLHPATPLAALAGDRDVLSPSAGTLAGSVLLGRRQRQLAAFRRVTAHVKQVGGFVLQRHL